MTDQGYTLVETMAALLIIGLAMSGLAAALGLMARQHASVAHAFARTSDLRRAQSTLEQLFEGRGPFRSSEPSTFTGAAHFLQFDCGQPAPCKAELAQDPRSHLVLRVQGGSATTTIPLPDADAAHFRYQGSLGDLDAWPPVAEPRQALRGVAIIADGSDPHAVLTQTHLWTEEALVCGFDAVLQDCR